MGLVVLCLSSPRGFSTGAGTSVLGGVGDTFPHVCLKIPAARGCSVLALPVPTCLLVSPPLEGTVRFPHRVRSGEACAPMSLVGCLPASPWDVHPPCGEPCRLHLGGWGVMERLGDEGPPGRTAEQGPAAGVSPSS